MSEVLKVSSFSARDSKSSILRDISFSLEEGETMALIGESGSGKTMTLKAILSLLPGDVEKTSGSILVEGRDLFGMKEREKRAFLGSHIGFVPQNTVDYLHPLLRIGRQMCDGTEGSRKERLDRARELLLTVGLSDSERILDSYPSQLSGGMRQRVNIAAALMSSPSLLLSDEPTSALDRIVQAQVASLYLNLVREKNLSLVLVSHDLALVRKISRRTAVYYAGSIVEEGLTEEIFSSPSHPYTISLLSLIPGIHTDRTRPLSEIKGSLSSSDRNSPGCPFSSRCPFAEEECREKRTEIWLSGTHRVLCRKGGKL